MTNDVENEHPPLIRCSRGEEAVHDFRSETKTQQDNLQIRSAGK